MTLATSALPGRWRVGSVEVAGAAVRPRALLVRRGTGQPADGAAGADREMWFGEVRVEVGPASTCSRRPSHRESNATL